MTDKYIRRKKNKRYILMLDSTSASALKRVSNELQIKLTSSAELSSAVKADDILKTDNGLLFKNIGIAVIENIEAQQLIYTSGLSNNKILYWEEERTFYTAGTYEDHISKIKQHIQNLNSEVSSLETFLQELDLRKDDIKHQMLKYTWGLESMNIQNTTLSGKGIDVCILDTGFYTAHPDFQNRHITGKTFIPEKAWDFDGDGHGTHCTGTALGNISSENGQKYGIAHEANIIIGKVLDDRGRGSTSGIIDAIDWALEKKYRIISMSLASQVSVGEKPSPIFEQIGLKALEQNTLIIAAAGNDSNRPNPPKPVSSPANASQIMAVSAVDKSLKTARFSNSGINPLYGGKVDLAGPGVSVYSSHSKNAKGGTLYKTMDGTSMATPHISGLAALYCEKQPDISASELWKKLEKNALKLPKLDDRDIGFGLGYFK